MVVTAIHKGKTFKRVGRCNGCSWCCSLGTLAWDHIDDKMVKVYVDSLHSCPDFDRKTKRCKVYKERPEQCHDFPEHPLQTQFIEKMGGKCSYSWVEVNPRSKPVKKNKLLMIFSTLYNHICSVNLF
jgi:uncharacterized cysteine cluster protein YcgN (CxxCxxCC family)